MAADPVEVRLARLEGSYEQIDKRLAVIEGDIRALRSELQGLRSEMHSQIQGLRSEMHSQIQDLRRELTGRMDRQFYWLITLVVASILVPIAIRVFAP